MLPINIVFQRYDEATLAELLGAVGVYSVWAYGATHRPTYMGEGVILERLAQHVKTWKRNIVGLVAVLADTGKEKDIGKFEAVIGEAFLLQLGTVLNRAPTQNSAPGYVGTLRDACNTWNKIRVNIHGFHPFTHPEHSRSRLTGKAVVEVQLDDDGAFLFDPCPWNARS